MPITKVLVFVGPNDDDRRNDVLVSDFAGYVPGATYRISVWVIGPALPHAGFNLEALGGTLTPGAGYQVMHSTECDVMTSEFGCVPGSTNDCQVQRNDGCPVFDTSNEACVRCSRTQQGDPNLCRPCDGAHTVSAHATHTQPKVDPVFDVIWTAPNPGIGDVKVYIAGNSVSGEGTSAGDFWSFVDPNPLTLRQASQ